MKAVFVPLIALALSSSPALASVQSDLAAVDARLKACVDKDSSNVGMKMCTNDAYDTADKLLTRNYKCIVAALKNPKTEASEAADSKEKLKRLIASERAWVAYKDTECNLRGVEMLGGSGEGLVVVDCLFTLTKQRAKDISDLFDCK